MTMHTQSEVNIVIAEIILLHYKTNLSLPTVPNIHHSGSTLGMLEYEMEFLQTDSTIYMISDNLICYSYALIKKFNQYTQW